MASVEPAPTVFVERPYANYVEAHQDGRWDIPHDDPAYWDGGARDNEGYACDP